MADVEKIERIEKLVTKVITIILGCVISITTYLIQTKIAEMSDSMKSIEKTTNAIQIQQAGFAKDVEYLKSEQQNLVDRVKHLER